MELFGDHRELYGLFQVSDMLLMLSFQQSLWKSSSSSQSCLLVCTKLGECVAKPMRSDKYRTNLQHQIWCQHHNQRLQEEISQRSQGSKPVSRHGIMMPGRSLAMRSEPQIDWDAIGPDTIWLSKTGGKTWEVCPWQESIGSRWFQVVWNLFSLLLRPADTIWLPAGAQDDDFHYYASGLHLRELSLLVCSATQLARLPTSHHRPLWSKRGDELPPWRARQSLMICSHLELLPIQIL